MKENKKANEDFVKELFGRLDEENNKRETDEIFREEDFENGGEPEEKNVNEKEVFGNIEIFENGKKFFVSEKAVAEFAEAVGRKPEEVIKIYEKGCSEEKEDGKIDSEVFEKLAKLRGISKEEMRAEILGALEMAKIEKAAEEILIKNPGMNRNTAEELARFRMKKEKPSAEKESGEDIIEKLKGKIRELDIFCAKHRGEGVADLEKEVIDEWEGGIPLEKAFERFMAQREKEKLAAEIEELKKEKEKSGHKEYVREHSTGSAVSAAGSGGFDAFVEGLFKEY